MSAVSYVVFLDIDCFISYIITYPSCRIFLICFEPTFIFISSNDLSFYSHVIRSIHILNITGLAVVTGLRYPSRVATQMLTETYGDYIPALGEKSKTAPPNSLHKASKPILTRFCQKYSDVQSVDKASALIGKVEGVKVQMQDNIASMLQNMEQTEAISDQANHLNEQASVFKKKSTDLKRHMKCKNLKMTLIISGLILGILLIILVPMISRAKKASGGGNNDTDDGQGGN
jgi:vesicle-associated membrane protein 7